MKNNTTTHTQFLTFVQRQRLKKAKLRRIFNTKLAQTLVTVATLIYLIFVPVILGYIPYTLTTFLIIISLMTLNMLKVRDII
jgi:putative flippase GtrA